MDATTLAVIGAGCSVVMAGSVVIGFWMRFENRTTKAEATADEANRRAAEANKLADEAHNRITLLAAEFGLYREHVASNYINFKRMEDVEERMTAALNRLTDRIDRYIAPHAQT